MGAIFRFVDASIVRFTWRFSPARVLHRIRVAICLADAREDLYFDRVDEALDLIARFAPATLDEIRHRFTGILVFGTERFRLAHWNNNAKLCIITGPHLANSAAAPEEVAMTLVHESMHARLSGAGVSYREGRRAPIEVICAMAELAFARRVPNLTPLVRACEQRIERWSLGGEETWSNQARRDNTLEHIRKSGVPGWLVTVLDRISRVFYRRAA